jgi:putative MATE family efflux protein
MLNKYIGDKAFYKKVLAVTLPMIIQMLLLTTFGIADTIMVSSIFRGVAGVGIGAQIENVIITIVFGINSGIGVFISQFFGAKDSNNIKNTFALGLFFNAIFAITATLLIYLFMSPLVTLFSRDPEVVNVTMSYLRIAALSYIPVVINFTFSLAYRNIQKTKIPLYIGTISSFLNLLLNYLLIFGIWIFPELGVRGAAIATVISSSIGALINISYGIFSSQIFIPKLVNFFGGLKTDFVAKLTPRLVPLILNEIVYAIGISLYIIFINVLGSDAYEGYRIAESIANILFVIVFAIAMATSVFIGEALGKKDIELAESYSRYFFFIGGVTSIILGFVTFFIAPLAVNLYQVKDVAVINNAVIVMQAFTLRVMTRVITAIMFATFRAGGESRYVMFLDSGLQWIFGIPIAFIATYVLKVQNIAILFLIIQIEQIIRVFIGARRLSKRTWMMNLTEEIKRTQLSK